VYLLQSLIIVLLDFGQNPAHGLKGFGPSKLRLHHVAPSSFP